MAAFRIEQGNIFIHFRKIRALAQKLKLASDLFPQPDLGLPVGRLLQLAFQQAGRLICRSGKLSRSGDNFPCRRDGHASDLVDGPLVGGIERPNGIDIFVKELDPVRQRRIHRIEIEDASPDAQFSAVLHPFNPFVAHFNHGVQERLQLKRPVLLNGNLRIRHDLRRWQQTPHARIRRDHNAPESLRAFVQHLDTLGHCLRARDRRFGRDELIGRIQQNLFRRKRFLQVIGNFLRREHVVRHDEHRPGSLFMQSSEHNLPRRSRKTRDQLLFHSGGDAFGYRLKIGIFGKSLNKTL
ncbi:hypothetical protein D3C71_1432230 [compost metagenome]